MIKDESIKPVTQICASLRTGTNNAQEQEPIPTLRNIENRPRPCAKKNRYHFFGIGIFFALYSLSPVIETVI